MVSFSGKKIQNFNAQGCHDRAADAVVQICITCLHPHSPGIIRAFFSIKQNKLCHISDKAAALQSHAEVNIPKRLIILK